MVRERGGQSDGKENADVLEDTHQGKWVVGWRDQEEEKGRNVEVVMLNASSLRSRSRFHDLRSKKNNVLIWLDDVKEVIEARDVWTQFDKQDVKATAHDAVMIKREDWEA